MENLSLDPITVNTTLAVNYLKKYNNFEPWLAPGKVWHVKLYPDIIVEDDIANYWDYVKKQDKRKEIKFVTQKLVKKLQEHESLFFQLEYLMRKTDEANVKKSLHLIYQHLQCDEESWSFGTEDSINIYMNESSPLYTLGAVAAALRPNARVTIVSTQNMAPICHLFVEICAQVGWAIPLSFSVDVNAFKNHPHTNSYEIFAENEACKCIGVIAESADIDSALDRFIDASVTAPWKLGHIYVQESVYDEVKDALAAKCSRDLNPDCLDAFSVNGKLFVCDELVAELGTSEATQGRVPVEAYRTAKELCALLQHHPTPSLSLWAADSQLAHEVALDAPAPLVWINDYASFHGPPASSLPVYEQIFPRRENYVVEPIANGFVSRWTDWRKLTKNQRTHLIVDNLQGLPTAPEDTYDSDVYNILNVIMKARDDSFVSVEDGKICFGVQRQMRNEDIVNICESKETSIANHIISVINGAAIINYSSAQSTLQILKSLELSGVPVLWDADRKRAGPRVCVRQNQMTKKLKVVRSNFGTIFAN